MLIPSALLSRVAFGVVCNLPSQAVPKKKSNLPAADWPTLNPNPAGTLTLTAPCRGTLLIRNSNPPQGHYRALGTGLQQGPRGELSLMSEVPL